MCRVLNRTLHFGERERLIPRTISKSSANMYLFITTTLTHYHFPLGMRGRRNVIMMGGTAVNVLATGTRITVAGSMTSTAWTQQQESTYWAVRWCQLDNQQYLLVSPARTIAG